MAVYILFQVFKVPPVNFFVSSYHHTIISSYHHIIISSLSSYHHIIISSYHHITISSFHHTIILSYHHIIISSYQQPDFPEKRTRHFSKNLDKRPGERTFRKGFRYKSRDDRPNSPKSGMWISKTSNGSKIARIAPISTIFGWNRSRRPKLCFQKFSRRRKKIRANGKIVANERRTNDRRTNARKKFTGGTFATNLFVGYKIQTAILIWMPCHIDLDGIAINEINRDKG